MTSTERDPRWNRCSSSPTRAPPELAQALDLAGYPWKAVGDERRPRAPSPTTAGPAAVIVRRRRPRGRVRPVPGAAQARPAARAAAAARVAAPSSATSSCATTCSTTSASYPFQPRELEARLKHLFWRTGRGTRPELVEYGAAGAQPRDLPGRHRGHAARPHLHGVRAAEVPGVAPRQGVHPRDAAVSRVWGYEYYGGARTVDVHIRRLRAKLGEEHASLIQTVRSVGYRFGQSRWGCSVTRLPGRPRRQLVEGDRARCPRAASASVLEGPAERRRRSAPCRIRTATGMATTRTITMTMAPTIGAIIRPTPGPRLDFDQRAERSSATPTADRAGRWSPNASA